MSRSYGDSGVAMLHGVPRIAPALDSPRKAVRGKPRTWSIPSIMETACSIERVISLECLCFTCKFNKVIA